jgi:hypothetical protein
LNVVQTFLVWFCLKTFIFISSFRLSFIRPARRGRFSESFFRLRLVVSSFSSLCRKKGHIVSHNGTDDSGSQSSDEADFVQEGQLVSASVVLQAAGDDAVDGNLASSSSTSMTGVAESSFQSWVEDDRNVPPDNPVQYVIMMMMTIDETFSVDVPPWSVQRGKKGFKPNLALYRRELRRTARSKRHERNGTSETATVAVLANFGKYFLTIARGRKRIGSK